jgi:hypothetical protein
MKPKTGKVAFLPWKGELCQESVLTLVHYPQISNKVITTRYNILNYSNEKTGLLFKFHF